MKKLAKMAKMATIAMIILTCITGMVIPTMANAQDLEQELIQLPAFKFWNHDDNGIGYGNCPVYTAPYRNAYRCADGKASCYTNAQMSEAGYYSGWLLVRYETNNGGYRVGYIPPEYVKGFKSKMGKRRFEHKIPATANDKIYITDDPLMPGSYFAVLKAGTKFHVLAKYTYYGDWWYIECKVDGQVARGFIDRSSSDFRVGTESKSGKDNGKNSGSKKSKKKQAEKEKDSTQDGIPIISNIGTPFIGYVMIDGGYSGDRKIVRQNANPNAAAVSFAYPGNEYPYYAKKRGTTGKDWYLIWIDDDSAWGWISSGFAYIVS